MRKLTIIILVLTGLFAFTRSVLANNSSCLIAPCGEDNPCQCCQSITSNDSNDPNTPHLVTENCVVECSDWETIQIKVKILNGDFTCPPPIAGGPHVDDDKDGDVDYTDLLAELQKILNVGPQSGLVIAGYLRDGSKTFLRADVNGDKLVNANDTAYFTKWYTNKVNPAPTCMKAADINDDGKVDSKDYSEFASRVTTGNIPPPFTSAAKDPTPDDLTCGPSIASLMGTAPPPSTTVPPPPSTTSYGN